MTRNQLQTNAEVCMYALTVSTVEPKNIKEAMLDHSWIESMQDELNQFKCLDMDVKTAFLNGPLKEEGFVRQPNGFVDPYFPNHVYRLKKPLYGLKQAPRAWYDKLSSFLIEHHFTKGIVDLILFTRRHGDDILLVQNYVDDIIFRLTKPVFSTRFAKLMKDNFEMSMIGEMKFFLGLQVQQSPRGIFICQSQYTMDLLKKHGMEKCDTISTPMATTKLDADLQGTQVDQTKYRSMIKGLMYLTAIRPDIAFATSVYADLVGCNDDCKSTSRGIQFLVDKLVSWSLKKQDYTAMSTMEVEYASLSACCAQVIWMRTQLLDYGFLYNKIPMYYDSQSAIAISCNPKKEAIQYPRFIKLIFAYLMKKFPNIPQMIDEDYHSIKDDILLIGVYTIGNVLVCRMLISDEFLTKEICATDDFKEYETVFVRVDVLMNQPQLVVSTQGTHRSTPRAHRTPTVSTASPQGKKRKQIVGESSSPQKSLKITIRQKQVVEGEKYDDDSEDRLEPGSHKKNPEYVNDDDDEENVYEKKDAEIGSLETRTGEMQTPITTPPRSPRTILSSDNKYSHLPGALRRMCRRQGYMIQNMERKATDDLIENNLKPSIAATIIEDRDAFGLEVPNLVSQEFNAQAPKIIEELFKNYIQSNVIQVYPTTTTSTETTSSVDLQQQLYLKMKRSLQDQANDAVLWEEWDAWVEETVIDEDEVIPEDETPELITEL
ncbi:retrovirus-related pol polyprotein from transposon TNT 1-94 [Tanacetum coccineum]|uniref:Retrovirus-related pol polyprotein from transposon TNT 1-94 n=1 Tax=Tanacetum coccineum TaxID=301880 RepID=A0ABQ5A8E6_9ASTR